MWLKSRLCVFISIHGHRHAHLFLSVLFFLVSLYFVLKSFFHLFLNPAMVPDENSMEDPLCNFSFRSMVSLDYVTPDTDPERYDPGGRRSGGIGTALLNVAHDLQGRSSEHRVPDSEGPDAWRLLTEKFEPKMRTRFAGQLMSILSFSLQGDTAERITAWEREIATYERDSGKVLDDEIKIGTFLLRLPESQLKTHLLLRVDTLKKWTDFSGEVVAISRAISAAQAQPDRNGHWSCGKGTVW